MKPLQKVKGILKLEEYNLPMVRHEIFEPYCDYHKVFDSIYKFINRDGYVSIRTDSETERGGSSPFLFMCKDVEEAKDWALQNNNWWIIVTESIIPEDVLVQCHVQLRELFGRYRLTGECNDQDTASCRQAVARGTKSSGLRPIETASEYNHVWMALYYMLKRRRLYDLLAEVTVTKQNRIVFWEI